MKKKAKKDAPKVIPITSCKGKRGCQWEGEPTGISQLKIAA